MEAVHNCKVKVDAADFQHEGLIKEVDEQIPWILVRENELKVKEMRLEKVGVKRELEESEKRCSSKVH